MNELKPFLAALVGVVSIEAMPFFDLVWLHHEKITFGIQSIIGLLTIIYIIKKTWKQSKTF